MTTPEKMSYEMRLTNSEALTGYFVCAPTDHEMSMGEALRLLESRPMDTFLHRHVLSGLCSLDSDEFAALVNGNDRWSPFALALFMEASLEVPCFRSHLSHFEMDDSLLSMTPLINLKSSKMNEKADNEKWISVLRENIVHHRPLNAAEENVRFILQSNMKHEPASLKMAVHVRRAFDDSFEMEHDFPRRIVSAAGAQAMAKSRLDKAGVLVDSLMRHVSSLSPVALLQKWRLKRHVANGRNLFDLSGIHTAYGKGLSLDDAMASCMMEVVERYCSYADVADGMIAGLQRDCPVQMSSFSKLSRSLDPSSLGLEVPYLDEPLWWMWGEQATGKGKQDILVPCQLAFLFFNLDEPELFSGFGSTGLAAHTEMASAKVSALLECLERDCDTISLFDHSSCFRLSTRDPELSALFAAYQSKGISFQFQDITSDMGIPCFRCYVVQNDGIIVKGTGAGLSSKKALLSAMMETPYPFPYGPPSAPCFTDLPLRLIEDFPDYETGNPFQDLFVLERTLVANGHEPVYVDLTRSDIGLPVVRAIVPGFELMNDFDDFSRVSQRMKDSFFSYFKDQDLKKSFRYSNDGQ